MKDNSIDAQIRAAMTASGLNRFEISKRSGVAYSNIHGFAAGVRSLETRTADRILKALGLTFTIRPAKKGKA